MLGAQQSQRDQVEEPMEVEGLSSSFAQMSWNDEVEEYEAEQDQDVLELYAEEDDLERTEAEVLVAPGITITVPTVSPKKTPVRQNSPED